MDEHRAVIESAGEMVPQGEAHHGEHIQIAGGGEDGGKALLGSLQQGALEKEIAAGGTGETKLGQDKNPNPLLGGLPHEGENSLGIVMAVAHPDFRCASRYLNKTIPHNNPPFAAPGGRNQNELAAAAECRGSCLTEYFLS
jgi:hypothetical protein